MTTVDANQMSSVKWVAVLGFILTGAAAGWGLSYLFSPKYEAVGIVRVGQVASEPIETALNSTERMKSLAFQKDVEQLLVARSGQQKVAQTSSDTELPNFLPRLLKGGDFIAIEARASTPSRAHDIVEAVVSVLNSRHEAMAKDSIAIVNRQIAETKSAVKRLEPLEVPDAVTATTTSRAETPGTAFLDLARIGEAATYRNLRTLQMDLETALQRPNTRPTETVETVFVGDKPVFPNHLLFLLAGGLTGGFIALLTFFKGAAALFKYN
jgi:capsular polysaccharide biosynthesis protein